MSAATMPHRNRLGPKQKARLIAAAPELLDAVTYLLDVIDKAGLGNLMHGVQLGQMSWYVKATDAVDACKSAIAKATGGAQ